MMERLPRAFSGLHYAAVSDVGLRRANNQDSFAAVVARHEELWQNRGHIFLVADGMGAHAAGELASRMAADLIPHNYLQFREFAPIDALHSAVREANAKIFARGQANPEFHGMGTTCTSLVVMPGGCFAGHAGDSRLYRIRKGTIEQLTFDHSLVWELRAAGQIHNEQVSSMVPKNIITRSLGPNEEVRVDVEGPWNWEAGDTLLLCSDGLSGQLTDAEIGALAELLPVEEAAQTLTAIANLRGGPDNITTIVIRFPESPTDADLAQVMDQPAAKARWGQVQPIVWTALGVSLLATAMFAAVKNMLLTFTGIVGAAISLAFLLVQAFGKPKRNPGSPPDPGQGASPRGPSTHPPYVSVSNLPLPQLSKTLEKLCAEAYAGAEWMPAFPKQETELALARSRASMSAGKYDEASRELAAGLRNIMHRLRHPGL